MKARALALGLMALAGMAQAHEFWIDPESFVVPEGGDLVAAIRVGQTLNGASYGYIPPNFRRFDIVMEGATTPVEGRAGDRPALAMPAPGTGLAVVVHVTKDYTLTYREWEKFVSFAEHKDFEDVLEDHAARGMPREGFKERYSRHAKSLIAVGDGAGADAEMGLLTEFVALENPYTDDMSDGFDVQVLYQGEALNDVQVELFARAPSGDVTVTTHRTDSEGMARLPVEPGYMYLADHVVMRALDPEADGDPVWESLWASLTFGIPGAGLTGAATE